MRKEKLTEKINAISVTKTTKDSLIQIAENEDIQIQQVCRKLLSNGIKEYFEREKMNGQLTHQR